MMDEKIKTEVKGANELPLYNSRIIKVFINFLQEKYNNFDLSELLRYAQMERYEVEDSGHWFTQTQVNLFYERVLQITANQAVARQAGRYAATGNLLGFLSSYIQGFVGPAEAFLWIHKIGSYFTRSTTFEGKKISSNKVEITVTPKEGVHEEVYQCENRKGFLETVPILFSGQIPKLEHPECVFSGAKHCRYVIEWKTNFAAKIRIYKIFIILILLAAAFYLTLIKGLAPGLIILAATSVFFAVAYFLGRREVYELNESLLYMKESNEDLLDQTESNYRNAMLVNEVGLAIGHHSRLEDLLREIILALKKRLAYERCLILLLDSSKTQLNYSNSFGYSEHQVESLHKTSFKLQSNDNSWAIFSRVLKEIKPYLTSKKESLGSTTAGLILGHSGDDLEKKLGTETFICCPILCDGESYGVLVADNSKSKRPLLKSDLSLLMGISSVIGLRIRNAIYAQRERQISEQLQQTQKTEAIGLLAGGIAHDFNNILAIISGAANLLNHQIEKDSPLKKYADHILLGTQKASHLAGRLLDFSRQQEGSRVRIDVNRVLHGFINLLRGLIPENIELNCHVATEELPILAESSQIEQVVLNLLVNARDAMPQGGRLTLETKAISLDENVLKSYVNQKVRRYAMISVSDTGAGMSVEVQKRIFEPFYSTKARGKGSGMGLFIVNGIVKKFDGFIECNSAVGQGTAFKIYFPIQN